jgi:hypothetical protein
MAFGAHLILFLSGVARVGVLRFAVDRSTLTSKAAFTFSELFTSRWTL